MYIRGRCDLHDSQETTVPTRLRFRAVLITSRIGEILRSTKNGLCCLFLPHGMNSTDNACTLSLSSIAKQRTIQLRELKKYTI
uniref:Uncharacterized protein n=1 Tax=Heterorhabditis bacteriophora TaxID=37862 RepID=A0A1I7WB74_HETBA